MEEKIAEIRKLTELFQRNIRQYKSPTYDEANLRVDFIDKFFELLDWDVRNIQGFSEDYRDVVREDKVIISGKPKAPDYSFRIGGTRKFFLEAKKPSVDIKKDINPAFQVRRYAYSAKLPLSILTDFEEFSVYDTRIKPNKKDKASTARIFYCTYDEYEKHFDFIHNTFSKPAILKGSFDSYISDTKGKKGTSEVDKEFLKVIDSWRNELSRNIALRNIKLDVYNLNYAVQKIIDRIIFLRIAEDNHMEDYGMLISASREKNIYSRLDNIFAKANIKYNSSLFQFEHWLSKLKIDNKVLLSIIQDLYYPESPYEFSVLPIEILGNIYEQFLGKTIRLTPSHRAKVEEKPEVRKAGGVYYTPQYIVDYIVEHTVGEMIKGKKPEDIKKLNILDPACGSGSFLVGAFSYLLIFHLDYYTKKSHIKNALKDGNIYHVSGSTYRLTIQQKQSILLNNIFGVDIDTQAVEVTKLSLLLKLMQGESIESSGQLFKHSDLTLLPDLSNNIKCGNSLIGSDYYENKNLSLFNTVEMRRVNTFDWENEFANIQKKSGFDIIIGNPPYVFGGTYGISDKEKEYFKTKYISGSGKINLFALFIENSLKLLIKNGLVSYIIPNTYLRVTSYEAARKFILNESIICEIVDLGTDVFKKATTSSIIILLRNILPSAKSNVLAKTGLNGESREFYQTDFMQRGYLINVNADPSEISLIKKIKKRTIGLGEICRELRFGVVITKNRDKLVYSKPGRNRYPFLEGKDIDRYYIRPTNKFLLYERKLMHRPRTREIFEVREKLLVQRITGGDKPLKATYDNNKYYNKESINNIILKNNTPYNIKFILGLINSRFMNWFYASQFTNYSKLTVNISKEYLSQLPIPMINFLETREKSLHDKLVSLVGQMLKARKQLYREKSERIQILRMKKVNILDKQIDQLVYKLYGLTRREIKIVEGN